MLFPIKLETNDGYSIRITEEQFYELVNGDKPNNLFIWDEGSYSLGFLNAGIISDFGINVLLTRGYPRVRDVVGMMFQFLYEKHWGENEPGQPVYDFLMNLPKEAFIEGYKHIIHYFADDGEIWLPVHTMIVEKEITKKEFADDELWDLYKLILRNELAIDESEIFETVKDGYDESESFWKKFEQKVAEKYEGNCLVGILKYMESVED